MFQLGTGSSAKIGINEKNPLLTLDVNGSELMRGLFEMATMNYATPTKGYDSQPFNLESSAYNSSTKAYTLNHFQWQAEPVGNNTTTPGATLNLLYGTGKCVPQRDWAHHQQQGDLQFCSGTNFSWQRWHGNQRRAKCPQFRLHGHRIPVTTSGTLGLNSPLPQLTQTPPTPS